MDECILKRIRRILFTMRKANVTIKNIEDCLIFAKLLKTQNEYLLERIFFLSEEIPEIYREIKEIEERYGLL